MTVLRDRFRAGIDAHVSDLRERRARVWPAEVPREVRYPLGEITVTAHLRHWAREHGDRPAVVLGDRALSYGCPRWWGCCRSSAPPRCPAGSPGTSPTWPTRCGGCTAADPS